MADREVVRRSLTFKLSRDPKFLEKLADIECAAFRVAHDPARRRGH